MRCWLAAERAGGGASPHHMPTPSRRAPLPLLLPQEPESDYMDAALITVMQVGAEGCGPCACAAPARGRQSRAPGRCGAAPNHTAATNRSPPNQPYSALQIHLTEPEGDILLFLTGQEEIDTAAQVRGAGQTVGAPAPTPAPAPACPAAVLPLAHCSRPWADGCPDTIQAWPRTPAV